MDAEYDKGRGRTAPQRYLGFERARPKHSCLLLLGRSVHGDQQTGSSRRFDL